MVTAGVYLTVRLSPVLVQSVDAMTIIAWIGASTALLAALIAIRQDDIKKVLAYSTVSQLGYMFIGVGVGAFREGIFHLVTHAFFKGLLFLAAGSVMHALANETDLWRMGGLRKVMPVTFATSTIAWLAISGVPPFAGFFSKDQILTEAYLHGYGGVYLVGLVGAVLTAFYMTRWYVMVFLGPPATRGHPPSRVADVDDAAARRARGAQRHRRPGAQPRPLRSALPLPRTRHRRRHLGARLHAGRSARRAAAHRDLHRRRRHRHHARLARLRPP
jgi:NADH:ubiquinone oxidoreductase subunit 5 (subunit L)/multisubunit Na+/H+ antiporter MnhA subunit